MITIEKALDLEPEYPLEHVCRPEEMLFFDIETTGFSGSYSSLYLIGCVFFKNGSWRLIQWFADRADAEEEILHSFFCFLNSFSVLVHFNGDGFDIPYLLKRCQAYGLDYNFDRIKSIDIYRLIKPYKKFLGLDSLKQKSIECFLGICREDKYSGGQLIEVYEDYMQTQDEYLYNLLILHNEDDLKGMLSILPILFYHDFLNGAFTLKSQDIQEKQDIFGEKEKSLLLTYKGSCCLPVPAQSENSCFSLELSGELLCLAVPLFEGELKHFYSDYQNYYYLIYEDSAIHKSVGEYVEKSVKKKATAKTCYTRAAGLFLPQPSLIWESSLKTDYRDKLTYVPYSLELFNNENSAEQYIKEVLRTCFLK